ncbi:MAG: hypothetical protein IPP49_16305 [Saprospiraceae bacterium]|nr:hypothetical protein [Saprospiraceae bacterium]
MLNLDFETVWSKKYRKNSSTNEVSTLGFENYKDGWLIDVFNSINGNYENTVIHVKGNQPLEGCYYSEGAKPIFRNEVINLLPSNIQLGDDLPTAVEANIKILDLSVSSYNDCRIPNPCPKNCNEEVSHLKLIKEKRSNTFQVHPGSNDELLLSGFAVEDETYYYGTLKKDGSFAKINSFSSNQKNGLQKYIEHENFRYLTMSDGPNFVLKKETLNGVEVFTKVYNGVKKDITVHIYNERLLGSGGNFAFCLDLDGNMLWNKSILKNDAAPVNVASKDGIWNVFVNSLLELHITKIDIHGTLEISKIVKLPYPSNSNFIQGVASDLGGLVFKLGLTLPEGVRNILVKVDKNGSVEYSKYVENDTGSFAGYSENSGYVLHHTVIPTSAGVERKFNLFNPDGDIVYTKELSVACDVNQISKFKHGWILNCRAADGDYIVYIFPETTEDCMIKNSVPVKTFELSLSSENTNLTISDLPNIMPNNMTELIMKNFNMAASKVCEIFIPCIEICDNGIDDDDNGLTDCNDPTCPCNTCLNKADLVLSSIDSIHCIGNEYMATLTICNKGDADFNGNVPLVFYNGNPWEKSVNALSTSLQFVGTLQKDSCAQVTYRFAKYRDGDIFAVINAKENLMTPFDQNTIFSDVDCNTTNNTKSIRFAPSIPTLDLGPDVEICRGQVVSLSAQDGFSSYQWQDFYPNKNYSAFTPGLYTVTVSDYCGNLQKDEILIKEKKLAPILLGDDKSICEGSTIEVNYITTMNGKFVWDDGLEGAYRKVDTAGSYTLGFYTPDNCVVKDTIEVKVIPAPILNLEDSIAICEGSSHTVTLSQTDLKYNWYDGDVSSTKVFNQAGVYTVSVSNDVCTVQDSFMIKSFRNLFSICQIP